MFAQRPACMLSEKGEFTSPRRTLRWPWQRFASHFSSTPSATFQTVGSNPTELMINVAFKLPFKTLPCSRHQVMQKDSEKNMSIKKLWK